MIGHAGAVRSFQPTVSSWRRAVEQAADGLRTWTARQVLTAAAAQAQQEGALATAVRFLDRALREPPDDPFPLLGSIGMALVAQLSVAVDYCSDEVCDRLYAVLEALG